MARDKKKDDLMFNCSQNHEQDYVVGLYQNKDQSNVRDVLGNGCDAGLISNSTHMEVYELVEVKLGLPIPV
jgi:hypothetical protein